MESYTRKDGKIITAAEVIERFKALESKKIDVEVNTPSDKVAVAVSFEWDDSFDMVLSFSGVVSYPDKWSLLIENFKFIDCSLHSQYGSELNEVTSLKPEGITTLVENFMLSKDYKCDEEVYFDTESIEESKEREYEFANPMKAHGLSNSDFI